MRSRNWVWMGLMVVGGALGGCATGGTSPGSGGSSSGCESDTDCKGDRVCQHGQCVAPGNTSATTTSSSTVTSGSGVQVQPGGSCQSDAQCDQSACNGNPSSCVDSGDGAGYVCDCHCNWGNECNSGCCVPVNSGAFFVCTDASYCKPLGTACSYQYECLNQCNGGGQAYCYQFSQTSGDICGCGCAANSDCNSGCCSSYTFSNGQTFGACADPGSFSCNGG